MTIDISPEIEGRLKDKADAVGVSIGEYIERLAKTFSNGIVY